VDLFQKKGSVVFAQKLFRDFDTFDKAALKKNSLAHWMRCLFFPSKRD